MGIAEATTEKIISVSFQAASLTASLLLQVLKSLVESFKQKNQGEFVFNTERGQKVEVKTGKMNLHDLSGKGSMDYLDISNKKEFKSIEGQCKKHHIDYAVLKSKTKPPTYSIFFQTKDTRILDKMLKNAIKEMEQQEEQKRKKEQPDKENPSKENLEQETVDQEQSEQEIRPAKENQETVAEEHPDKADQPGANANEKNRESMGKEEREKEEPVKTPKTEKSMPVQSNKPKVPTTDSVAREEKKETASRTEGDRQLNSGKDTDLINGKSGEKELANAEREAALTSIEAKLSAKELNQAMLGNGHFTSFKQLQIELSIKVAEEKNILSTPQVDKQKDRGSLDI